MQEGIVYLHIIAAVVVIGLLLYTVLQPKQIILSADEDDAINRLTVSGESTLDTPSNQATIHLRTDVLDKDPNVAQDSNARISQRVIEALQALGVKKDDIQTTDYRIEQVREWNHELKKYEDLGYRAGHTIKVSTSQLDKIGQFLKAAVDAGVNNVQNIDFSLTKDRQREIKSEVLSGASKMAQEKAEALATSLGVRLVKIVSVSESGFSASPRPVYYAKEMIAAEAAPPIQPSDVTAQASVSVVYEIS